MKDSLIFYLSQYEAIKELSDEQLGRLMRAIFERQLGNEVVLDMDIKIAFNFIINQLSVDKEKYEKKCENNKLNGGKGGRPKTETEKTERFFRKPKKTERFFRRREKTEWFF